MADDGPPYRSRVLKPVRELRKVSTAWINKSRTRGGVEELTSVCDLVLRASQLPPPSCRPRPPERHPNSSRSCLPTVQAHRSARRRERAEVRVSLAWADEADDPSKGRTSVSVPRLAAALPESLSLALPLSSARFRLAGPEAEISRSRSSSSSSKSSDSRSSESEKSSSFLAIEREEEVSRRSEQLQERESGREGARREGCCAGAWVEVAWREK